MPKPNQQFAVTVERGTITIVHDHISVTVERLERAMVEHRCRARGIGHTRPDGHVAYDKTYDE